MQVVVILSKVNPGEIYGVIEKPENQKMNELLMMWAKSNGLKQPPTNIKVVTLNVERFYDIWSKTLSFTESNQIRLDAIEFENRT